MTVRFEHLISVAVAAVLGFTAAARAENEKVPAPDMKSDPYKPRGVEVNTLITININEKLGTQTTTNSDVKKDSTVDASLTGILGGEIGMLKPEAKAASTRETKGTADLNHQETFTARITATVKEKQPNGNLYIEARKTITNHEETTSIVLSGDIDPTRIGADKTVSSDFIANAKIRYEGKGPISDANKRTLLGLLMDKLSPI
jgi:flagellar L-ring protein FlgH